jgi:transcriptional regulator with XRE-family HTH domain
MSQADVGRAIGTDGPQISRWESGTTPSRISALKLARLYDRLEKIIHDENTTRTRGITAS